MADASAVTTTHLQKTYRGGVQALRDLSVAIAPGEITALVGPNGAGKTTFLKILLGFERASAGAASVFGRDPWREREACLRNIGYVPQATGLYAGFTVRQQLDWAAMARADFDLALSAERMSRLGIPPGAEARKLSGGQQAQLALAIALGTHGRLLLLDEPLASLDPLARREFLHTLRRAAAADGATVILTSHIVSDVEDICSAIAVISNGLLQLHAPITAALQAHRIADPSSTLPDADLVAVFAGRSGHDVALWRRADAGGSDNPGDDPARRASLEDLVLGYLARDRQERTATSWS